MTPQELRDRSHRFALAVSRFCRSLPSDPFTRSVAVQLHDAATSVAANYRAVCRAQTRAAFVAKLSIVLEECDEAHGWLMQLDGLEIGDRGSRSDLLQECNELVAIFSAARRTAMTNSRTHR